MNIRPGLKLTILLLLAGSCLSAIAKTWYVRPDGGTRYSTNVPAGQCDGLADVSYPGSGINRHCAFKDARMLWSDGTYSYGTAFPSWGWVGSGGDTYIIRGSIGSGKSYRVGWNSLASYCDPTGCWGVTGDAASSGAPPPPSGTPTQHTRVLGENYASCKSPSAKTQLHGGWGVFFVLNMAGASYVDVACLDITDFSACGKAFQSVGCTLQQDFAHNGIIFSNKSTHDTLTDVRIHGLATAGIYGPTGDGVVLDRVELLGNASSGWDADTGDGTTGKGSLLVQHYNISWNGCAEEYPIVDRVPYGDCTDQAHGGYGDGFGTTTKDSDPPGWQVHFDAGTVSYNTQDGLDALHIGGKGSSMTVTNSLAYSNMGQQIKIGGATATMTNNVIVGNCRGMSYAVPGTPKGYNAKLSLFCRAGDTAVLINVPDAQPAVFEGNTIYSNNRIALEVEYPGDHPAANASIKYDDNIFIGFPGVDGRRPVPIYSNTNLKMFTNRGSSFRDNITYHAKGSWSCPAIFLHETGARCHDPHLKDETWPDYGIGDIAYIKAADVIASQGESAASYVPHDTEVVPAAIGAFILASGIFWAYRKRRSQADGA